MKPSFEQPISSLTANLTRKQNLSLVDLNLKVSEVAKQIKAEGKTPEHIKAALAIVERMHELAIGDNKKNESLIEIDPEKLGKLTNPVTNKDLTIFRSIPNTGEKVRFVYNEKGKKIGRPEGYQQVDSPHKVGNHIAMRFRLPSGHEGILYYGGGDLVEEIIPRNGATKVRFNKDLKGALAFVAEKPDGTVCICNAHGDEIDSLTKGEDYGTIESMSNGGIYFAVKKNGKEQLKASRGFTAYSQEVDKITEIFELPERAGDIYIQAIKDGRYTFHILNFQLDCGPFDIKANIKIINGSTFISGYHEGRFYIFDSFGAVVSNRDGYKEIKQLQDIGGKITYFAKKDNNEWIVIHGDNIIQTGGPYNVKELTSIGGKMFYVAADYENVNHISDKKLRKIYDAKGKSFSFGFLDIKHLLDIEGTPVYCAQDRDSKKWLVLKNDGLSNVLSQEFDEIFSFEKLDEPRTACVVGRIGQKFVRQIIDINEQ